MSKILDIGEIFSGTVRGMTSSGLGVTKHSSGKTVFVSGVWVEEQGQFRIREIKGKFAFGSLESLDVRSPHRIDPLCNHHGFKPHQCGGCPWQFIDYQAQLTEKQTRVEYALKYLVDNHSESVKTIWASPNIFNYRSRAQLKTDGQQIGYVTAKSNQLAPIKACPILTGQNQRTLADLLQQLPNADWFTDAKKSHQDKRSKSSKGKTRKKWVTLDIDESVTAKDVSVNERLAFHQANTEQNEKMRQWLANHLHNLIQDTSINKVTELFCGSGNFTEILSQSGIEDIVAIEGSEQATKALKQKELANVTTKTVDLFNDDAFAYAIKNNWDSDVLVLDPPRSGLKQTTNLFHKKANFQHVFYISCDLATFSRDAKLFLESGYEIIELQPLDQFPHTPHIETLCYLRKKA